MNQLNNYQKHLDLLANAKDLLIKNKQLKFNGVSRLLTEATPQIERIKKNTQKHALNFNVFDALGVTRKEVIQSRFLVYLLDPNQAHNQGIIFLEAFLKKSDIPVGIPLDFRHIKVTAEVGAGGGLGRMDIVIDCKPDWLIVIENKVDAGEQAEQLIRYAKWLNLNKNQGYRFKKLIFLTPTGYEAETGKNVDYLKLSYVDIADAFDVLLNEKKIKASSVRGVIAQYIKTCRLIGGINMVQNQDLIDLLSKPDNLRITLEIEQQAQLLRFQVANNFVENVKNIIQDKFDSNTREKWTVNSIVWADQSFNLEIRTITHQVKPNYKMFGDQIFNSKQLGRAGWQRPKWLDKS